MTGEVSVRIVLAGLWTALMLVYLLGDVLRIFAGDIVPGQMQGVVAKPWMWTVAALFMLVPVAMLLLSLVLPATALRWVTVIAALLVALFNVAGLPYKGFYDNLLIVVGIALNGVTVWQALTVEG